MRTDPKGQLQVVALAAHRGSTGRQQIRWLVVAQLSQSASGYRGELREPCKLFFIAGLVLGGASVVRLAF